jgi:hypothetical protein
MGYLQINKPDRALQYMRQSLQETENEQKIAQIPEDILGAILLGWVIRLRKEGIRLTISYPDIMKDQNYWQNNWFEEQAEAFYSYTKECPEVESAENNLPEQDKYAEIILEEEFTCIFRFLKAGVLLQEKRISFRKGSA